MICPSCGSGSGVAARFCPQCGVALPRGEDSQSGSLVSRLEAALAPHVDIVRPIGKGGMGAVFLGREPALDRDVAVKVLPLELAEKQELRERFRREARIAAKLSHPNIVPLYTFGDTGSLLYYVMGFVRGESLAERLERAGALDVDTTHRILSQLADALAYAHEMGVVHRDIKPENILLDDRTGRAVLTDFGVAKFADGVDRLTQTGGVLGTPHYMAPEQATGLETDARSDVYSLGVLAYRMLSGELPIKSESLGQLFAKHSRENEETIPPLDPSIPTNLSSVVMKCLRKRPADRFQTARDVRDVLGVDGATTQLPDEIRNLSGRGFLLLPFTLLALLLIPFEAFMWSAVEPGWRLLIMCLQFVPVLILVVTIGGATTARSAGLAWRDAFGLVLRAPDWAWWWMPSMMRSKEDVWPQLPAPLKRARIATTLSFPLLMIVIIAVPMMITAVGITSFPPAILQTIRVLVYAAVGCAVLSLAFQGLAEKFLKTKGFPAKDVLRIVTLPSSRVQAWREPMLRALLDESVSTITGIRGARTPNEQFDAIRSLASRLPPSIREETEAMAARLYESIQDRAKERAALVATRDEEELNRLESRLRSLESAPDSRELASMRDVLRSQLQLLRDIESRIAEIDAAKSDLDGQLASLWTEVAACVSSDRASRVDSLRRRLDSMAGTLAASDAETQVRGLEDEPTVAR